MLLYLLNNLVSHKVKLYRAFFITLTFLSTLPFLVLSFYSNPVADDYVFSGAYKKMGWLAFQQYFYFRWQGLYTTNALMCSPLNPVVHGRFDLYWLPCWLSIGSLIGSAGLLMRYLTRDKTAALALTCAVLLLYLYQVPSPAEALFWLNANWAYQMSISLGVLLLLLACKTFEREPVHRAYWGGTALLAVLLIGTNFIAAMLTAFGIGVGFLLSLRSRATRQWWGGLLVLASMALLVVVLAPGNVMRIKQGAGEAGALAAQAGSAMKLLHGVTHGIGLLGYSLVNWLGNGVVLALSVLLVPALAVVSNKTEAPINTLFKTRMLLLAGAVMVTLPFFPTYLVQGAPPVARVTNIIYQVFIFVWLFALYAAVAWMRRVAPASLRQPAYVSGAMSAFLLFALLTDANYTLTYQGKGRNLNNIALAYRDWLSGAAGQYDQQQEKRYQLMRAPGHAGVVLDSLSATPRTIFLGDLHPDTAHYANVAYALFFDKAYVRVNKSAH